MFSIIIPAYNEENYIAQTLEAIKRQDFHEYEILVVCNGCTDRTEELAKRYTDNVLSINEKGVSKARNFGASKAAGDTLIFLDADILMGKGLLSSIASSGYEVGTSKVKAGSEKQVAKTLMLFKNPAHYFGWCTGMFFCKKEIFQKVGGFDESRTIGENFPVLSRCKSLGRFGVVNAYVINNMRRFEKNGYGSVCLYWALHAFNKKKVKEYEAVR